MLVRQQRADEDFLPRPQHSRGAIDGLRWSTRTHGYRAFDWDQEPPGCSVRVAYLYAPRQKLARFLGPSVGGHLPYDPSYNPTK